MKIKFIYILVLNGLFQFAAIAKCPWNNYQDLLTLDQSRSVTHKELSKEEFLEDLDCFELIASQYVYEYPAPPKLLLNRVQTLRGVDGVLSSLMFAEELFNLHTGMLDYHFGYDIGEHSFGLMAPDKQSVELVQNFASEKLVSFATEKSKAIYFRPENFFGALTKGQANFIKTVLTTDGNYVIDLRGNGGGDDLFAFELTKAIFTSKEKIPQATSHQMSSLFIYAGLLNTIRSLEYRDIDEVETQILDALKSVKNFEDMLPSEVEDEVELLKGKRKKIFKGNVVLIFDGLCASACETVVEKLSTHPKVKTIGQPTYGALHYSNPAMFQLPHSGIIVRLPTLRHFYENDAEEGIGYTPQVLTDKVDLNFVFP